MSGLPIDGAGTSLHSVELRKIRFLAAYSQTANISDSALQAEVGRSTIYSWQESDDEFYAAMHQAREAAADLVEREIHRRGVEGVEEPVYQGGKLVGRIRKYSDVLLIFWAKALRPEKFRERHDVTTAGEPLLKAYVGVNLELVAGPAESETPL